MTPGRFIFKKVAVSFGLSIILFSIAPSQTELIPDQKPTPYHIQEYIRTSGIYNGNKIYGTQPVSVYQDFIQISDAPWSRLYFGKCDLGRRSFIKITSLEDGERQHLNSTTLKQWYNTSALFNGDALKVELYVAPEDQGIFFEIEKIMVGNRPTREGLTSISKVTSDPCTGRCGICGGIDDRVSSNDPAVGRIYPTCDIYGCTGWIASNGTYITAGHAPPGFGITTVLQFNVPKSLPDGTPQHPSICDQYPIIQAPDIPQPEYDPSGLGQDWAVFYCYPNSETGLLPVEVQNAFYRPTIDSDPDTFRVTGYGLDECPPGPDPNTDYRNEDSFTQQTSTGPNLGEYGSGNDFYWKFNVDIRSRSSGSPIIPLNTVLSAGIVTHGCGPNYGTSFKNTELAETLNTYISHDIMYVDNGHPSTFEDGTIFRPYDTVIEGVNTVPSGGMLCLVKGSYNESLTINKAMTIIAPVGDVTIGASPISKPITYEDKEYNKDPTMESSIPIKYIIHQNYPNPFNVTTTIYYALKEDVKVKLIIYNLMGQEVRVLVNENQSAGCYAVTWNGKDKYGEPLPSGIYIYKIDAGKFNKTLKLLMLK